jgi:hypothetical protein
MRFGYWLGFGVAGLLVLGILDYQNHFGNVSSPPITKDQVIKDVQKALTQNGDVPVNFQMIHINTKDANGFAFVKYQAHGKPQFAIIIASHDGYEMASGSFLPDKKEPIRSFSVSGDGWEFVAGMVNGHSEVKSAVMTFSNGTAASVPVENGYFWYIHQVKDQSINSNVHYLKVIGITSTGGIVTNQ